MFALLLLSVTGGVGSILSHSPCDSSEKAPGSAPLFRIARNNLWGYIDVEGRTVIPPRYQAARDFFEGLAPVLLAGRWGFIDTAGRMAIVPKFDAVRRFSEGVAAARAGHRWGYIDRMGTWTIRPGLQAAGDFREGLARVARWTKEECRDKRQRPDEESVLDGTRLCGCTLADCWPRDARVGFIDRTGRWAIAPVYRHAADFREGRAAVLLGAYSWGYIDRAGAAAIPAVYQEAGSFSGGLAAVRLTSGGMTYIDRQGRQRFAATFTYANTFSDGIAVAARSVERCTPVYGSDSIGHLAALFAVLRQSLGLDAPPPDTCGPTRWGVLDTQGRWIVPPQYDFLSEFYDGAAFAIRDGTGRSIDRNGHSVTSAYGESHFHDGLALNQGTYVDRAGRVVARFVE